MGRDMVRASGLLACIIGLLAPASESRASEAVGAAPEPTDASQPLEIRIPALIRQLDADKLEARQQASTELLGLGGAVIQPLAEALPRAETTMRGLSILRKLGDMPESSFAARQALQRLAQSESKPLASQASTLARTYEPAPMPRRMRGRGGMQFVQVQAFRAGGQRRIKVVGRNRTVEIREVIGGPISISRTERVDGVEQTTTVRAANLQALEKENPAAYALYRAHVGLGASELGQPFEVQFPAGQPEFEVLIPPGRGANRFAQPDPLAPDQQ